MLAKQREIQNLKDHQVYVEVEDKGQNCINTRWIITEKVVDSNTVIKARLVAKGFQEQIKDDLRTDSPTFECCLQLPLQIVGQ